LNNYSIIGDSLLLREKPRKDTLKGEMCGNFFVVKDRNKAFPEFIFYTDSSNIKGFANEENWKGFVQKRHNNLLLYYQHLDRTVTSQDPDFYNLIIIKMNKNNEFESYAFAPSTNSEIKKLPFVYPISRRYIALPSLQQFDSLVSDASFFKFINFSKPMKNEFPCFKSTDITFWEGLPESIKIISIIGGVTGAIGIGFYLFKFNVFKFFIK